MWVGLYVSTQLVLRSPLAGTMYRQTLSSDGGGLSTNILLSKFPIKFNTRIQIYRELETLSKSDCMQYEVWKMLSESFKILTAKLKT